jgi:MFS family permease
MDRIPSPSSSGGGSPRQQQQRQASVTSLVVEELPIPTHGVLLVCIVFGLFKTTTNSLLTFAPIVVSELDHDPHIGIYLMASFWAGNAAMAIPSSAFFNTLGRYYGFMIGMMLVGAAITICIVGIILHSYIFLIGGTFFFGCGTAILGFLRYAAAEVSAKSAVAKGSSVTLVLSAGIVSAVVGPLISALSYKMVQGHAYMGPFLVMGVLIIIAALILGKIQFPAVKSEEDAMNDAITADYSGMNAEQMPRTFGEILETSSFKVATGLAAVSTAGMDVFTSSIGIAMFIEYDISMAHVSVVLMIHFIGMTAPGLVSGALIMRYGVFTLCTLGWFFYLGALVCYYVGSSFEMFVVGSFLLGVGWNFTFSSSSILILGSTRKSEAHRKAHVQSAMDFWVYLTSATMSVVTASVYRIGQWRAILVLGTIFFGIFALGLGAIKLYDLEDELHFDNLLENEDKKKLAAARAPSEDGVEMSGSPLHNNNNNSNEGEFIGGAPRRSITRAYNMDLSLSEQEAGEAWATANNGGDRGRTDSNSSSRSSTDEYSSMTPRSKSITEEYRSSGKFRASALALALSEADKAKVEEAAAAGGGRGDSMGYSMENAATPQAAHGRRSRTSSQTSLEDIRLSAADAATAL